jgi:hypothetical protein
MPPVGGLDDLFQSELGAPTEQLFAVRRIAEGRHRVPLATGYDAVRYRPPGDRLDRVEYLEHG